MTKSNSTVFCSKVDADSLIREMEEKRDLYKEQLLSINKNLRRLKIILAKRTQGFQKVKIPVELLTTVQSKKEKLKWKDEVFALIVKLNFPLTCQIAYRKLFLYNHFSEMKQEFVLTNIRSAFYYLAEDDKVIKCKNPYGRGHVYGLIHQFNAKGDLHEKYDSLLKRELSIESNKILIE